MSGIRRRRRRFLALARHHSLSQQSLRQRIREWATERGLVMIIGDDRANIVSGSLSLSPTGRILVLAARPGQPTGVVPQ